MRKRREEVGGSRYGDGSELGLGEFEDGGEARGEDGEHEDAAGGEADGG